MIGLVVQPGVEFDHHQVIDFVPAKATALSRSIEPVAGMVFEAHSTDYQTPGPWRRWCGNTSRFSRSARV